SFQDVAAHVPYSVNLTGGGRAQRVRAMAATADFFRVMGKGPILGRTFTRDEEGPGHPVALLGARFHQRMFGGDPKVIGQTLELDGVTTTIIGVLPTAYEEPFDSPHGLPGQSQDRGPRDLWIPLEFEPERTAPNARGGRFLTVTARLAPGVTHAAA